MEMIKRTSVDKFLTWSGSQSRLRRQMGKSIANDGFFLGQMQGDGHDDC